MTDFRYRQPRLRLDPESYRDLCRQVLERDAWRCQFFGGLQNLEVHHQQYRSRSGDDHEGNLITLCATCHAVYTSEGIGCRVVATLGNQR